MDKPISESLALMPPCLLCVIALVLSLPLVGNTAEAQTTTTNANVATATPAAAASTPATIPHFSVELVVEKSQINIGDTVTVTVTYRWPSGTTVVSPDGEPDAARDFSHEFVTNIPPAQRLSSGQEERRVFTITVAAQRNGAWELPRPTLTIKTKDGTRSTAAPAVMVQVGKESAPPQLPAAIPAWTQAKAPLQPTKTWWWLVVAPLAMIAVIAWLLRRKQQLLVTQTPWEIFQQHWQAAASAADGKESGARLSLGLRQCLGTLFSFDGPAATAKEATSFLRQRLPDHEHRDLARLLEQLDALRWAADDLPPSSVRPLLDASRSWIGALKQRLDAEAEAAKQAQANGSPTPVGASTP